MIKINFNQMDIKIATLNLCLGLQSKKNIVKETIIDEKIDILSMQETEINPNLNHNLLSFPGYVIETETNSECARVAFYISTRINYVRRRDLEGNDSNIIVIDLEGDKKWRLINVYRSFAPQHNVTQRDKFVYQLGLVKQAFTTSSILLGDFNLDWQRRHDVSYSHKNYFSDMENLLGTLNLNQLVNFTTWTRTINGEVKQSTLDHIFHKPHVLHT